MNIVDNLTDLLLSSRKISNGYGVTGGGDLTADRTLAVALGYSTGTLGADTNSGVSNAFTDIMSTASLGIGTWAVLWVATAVSGATGATVTAQCVAGTATATLSGPTASAVFLDAGIAQGAATIPTIAVITVAGTLKLQGASSSSVAMAFKKNPPAGSGGATGYVALQIA